MSAIEDIRTAMKDGKLVVGTKEVLKGLKLGKIPKVFVSINCPDDVKESISHYAEISGAEVVQLKQPNDELGVVCKKPYSISVLGIGA